TQNDLFDAKTESVKSKTEVFGKPKSLTSRPDPGLQLRQLAGILSAHGLDTTVRVADDGVTDDAMRKEIAANLAREGDFVIVNYLRSALGQEGGGHISPLGAYDEASDSFLVMDVNPNGHTWVWVGAEALFKAMRTKDTSENRGYVLVREPGAAK
ncbi:MAG TPA: phytochelatin synthase family protein, partial [bacterium]|nr:phytochelatin synthase family protein [bacterium]